MPKEEEDERRCEVCDEKLVGSEKEYGTCGECGRRYMRVTNE